MLCLLLGQTQTTSNLLGPAWIAFGGLILVQVSLHIADWVRSSREKTKEKDARAYMLKKELFMNLLASYYEGVVNLGKIPNAKHSDLEALAPSQRSLEAMAAKDLIASRGLLLRTQKASRVFGQTFLALLSAKQEESKISVEVEALGIRTSPLLASQQKVMEEIAMLEHTADESRVSRLQNYFDSINQILLPLLQRQSDLVQSQGHLKAALTGLHASLLPELNGAIGKVVIAMRKDLGIATDDEVISAILQTSDPEFSFNLKEFMDSIWTTFGTKNQGEADAGEAPDK